MVNCNVVVINKTGIHARPAATFAQMAKGFQSEVTIAKAGQDIKKNAKSLVGIMSLGIKQGDEVVIEAVGADENEALNALKELVLSGCGE